MSLLLEVEDVVAGHSQADEKFVFKKKSQSLGFWDGMLVFGDWRQISGLFSFPEGSSRCRYMLS